MPRMARLAERYKVLRCVVRHILVDVMNDKVAPLYRLPPPRNRAQHLGNLAHHALMLVALHDKRAHLRKPLRIARARLVVRVARPTHPGCVHRVRTLIRAELLPRRLRLKDQPATVAAAFGHGPQRAGRLLACWRAILAASIARHPVAAPLAYRRMLHGVVCIRACPRAIRVRVASLHRPVVLIAHSLEWCLALRTFQCHRLAAQALIARAAHRAFG
jgi:hypothetical protein